LGQGTNLAPAPRAGAAARHHLVAEAQLGERQMTLEVAGEARSFIARQGGYTGGELTVSYDNPSMMESGRNYGS
jgi:hypothetical protein